MDGQTIEVEVENATLSVHTRGEGPPLVLLHGFTGCREDWVHLFEMDALAASHRLVMPDARAHGHSTGAPETFSHRRCAQDLIAILDALSIEQCRAIGLSLGGNTLLHAATRAPDRISKMVTIAAPSYFPEQARTIMRSFSEDTRSPEEWEVMRARHPRGDDQIRALWTIARGFAEHHDDMAFTPPLLATIRARTLIVTGDRDPLYPIEIFVEQYRAIPDATLCVLPSGGHEAVFGPAKDFFVKTALDFLT